MGGTGGTLPGREGKAFPAGLGNAVCFTFLTDGCATGSGMDFAVGAEGTEGVETAGTSGAAGVARTMGTGANAGAGAESGTEGTAGDTGVLGITGAGAGSGAGTDNAEPEVVDSCIVEEETVWNWSFCTGSAAVTCLWISASASLAILSAHPCLSSERENIGEHIIISNPMPNTIEEARSTRYLTKALLSPAGSIPLR